MTKTATVSLHGNTYEVDAALIGRRVELVFDPFDLTDIAVSYTGRDMGTAIPHRLGRHVHPAVTPTHPDQPAPVTGIDYLSLVRDRHATALTHRVNYAAMNPPEPEPARPELARVEPGGDQAIAVLPGQTDLLDQLTPTHSNDRVEHEPQEQT